MTETQNEELLHSITHCRELTLQLPSTALRIPPLPPLPTEHTFFTPTPGEGFPHVHQENPAQKLNGFPTDIIKNWLSGPGLKLVVRIFDYDDNAYRSHELPKGILAATLAVIAADPSLNSPSPTCIPPPANGALSPCWLINSILESVHRRLLNKRIWSSKWITFEALPPTIGPHPSAFFVIGAFSGVDPNPPKEFLRAAWTAPLNAKRLTELIREDEPELDTKDVTDHLLHTLVLHPFSYPKTQRFGFVVHISTWWSELDHWANVKKTLLSLEYPTAPPYEGIHLTALPYCSLCHSVDHPRFKCPFPELPFWYGPE